MDLQCGSIPAIKLGNIMCNNGYVLVDQIPLPVPLNFLVKNVSCHLDELQVKPREFAMSNQWHAAG